MDLVRSIEEAGNQRICSPLRMLQELGSLFCGIGCDKNTKHVVHCTTRKPHYVTLGVMVRNLLMVVVQPHTRALGRERRPKQLSTSRMAADIYSSIVTGLFSVKQKFLDT